MALLHFIRNVVGDAITITSDAVVCFLMSLVCIDVTFREVRDQSLGEQASALRDSDAIASAEFRSLEDARRIFDMHEERRESVFQSMRLLLALSTLSFAVLGTWEVSDSGPFQTIAAACFSASTLLTLAYLGRSLWRIPRIDHDLVGERSVVECRVLRTYDYCVRHNEPKYAFQTSLFGAALRYFVIGLLASTLRLTLA